MRRILVVAAAMALLFSLPSVASAAPVTRYTDQAIQLSCFPIEGEGGTAVVLGQLSQRFGNDAVVGFWADGVEYPASPPTLISREVELSGGANFLHAVMQLYTFVAPLPEDPNPDIYGDPAGEAILSVSFANVGDPVETHYVSQGSNAKVRIDSVTQELAVSGTLTLPGATFEDFSNCDALRQDSTVFATSPSVTVQRSEVMVLNCQWTDDSRTIQLFASNDPFGGTHSDLYVLDESGEYGGMAEASLSTSSFSAEYQLSPDGSASASATLLPTGDKWRLFDRLDGETVKIRFEMYSVEGELTLTTPAGTSVLPMAGNCEGAHESVMNTFRSVHEG